MARQNSGEPLHVKITDAIRADIFAGRLNPGDMLSSEAALMAQYTASRDTVRKSLKELEHQGLTYTWPGKGYFVAKPEHNLFSVFFPDEDSQHEQKYHTIYVEHPDDEVKEALELGPKKQVIKISRIILTGGRPVAYDVKFMPYDRGTPLIEAEIQYAVFPEIAAAKTAPFAFYTEMDICAELPRPEVQKALKCGENSPLLVARRLLIGQNHKKIGYGTKYMLPEYGSLRATSGYKEAAE